MFLIPKVYNCIQKNLRVPSGSTILLGVSGGMDSVVLLHILRELHSRLGWSLHVATLDHQLRGQAGADDAAYVVSLSDAWGIPVTQGTVDVPALAAEQQLGIEAAARQARYRFLAQAARQINTLYIATAHHTDDQAETILMHLIRGSGTQGLSGMRYRLPMPGHSDLELLRPLLTTSRSEIEAYSQQHGLQSRSDATNQDTTYRRNRLRLEILPALREINPAIHLALLHLADNAAVDLDYISQQLKDVIAAAVTTTSPGSLQIDRATFQALHPALQRHLLHWAAQSLGNHDLDYAHTRHAQEIVSHGQQGARALLPGGLQLRIDYEKISIEAQATTGLAEHTGPLLPSNFETYLQVPALLPLTGTQWSIQLDFAPIGPNAQQLAAEPDAVISLRTRRSGDSFTPLGLHGKAQKLNKWFIDHKIPRELRDFIPLLLINGQIAAFYVHEQWTISHLHAVHQDTASVIHVILTNSHN